MPKKKKWLLRKIPTKKSHQTTTTAWKTLRMTKAKTWVMTMAGMMTEEMMAAMTVAIRRIR